MNRLHRFTFEGRNAKVREQILKRLKPRDAREDTFTGPDDDGKEPFLDAFERYPDEPYIVCLAHGIVESWMVSDPIITEGEYFVGFTRPNRPIYDHFSKGLRGGWERSERAAKLKERMLPLDRDYIDRKGGPLMGDAYGPAFQLWFPGAFQGHTVPSYNKLMKLGIGGTIEQINHYDSITPTCNTRKKDFYRACRIIMEGFSAWLKKYADACEELSKTAEGEWAGQLLEIAANCRKVSWDAPTNLREAGQLMWGFALWDCVDCVGRFDQYMYPFWTGSDEDRQMIADLIMKVWEHGSHNVVLGGVKPCDGSDASNDITYLVIQIIRANHDVHPRVAVRIHENTPEDLLGLIVETWSEGMSDPTVASDVQIIPGLMNMGVTLEDARDYAILGCQEIEIPGKSNFGCEDGTINLAKLLELTLNNGQNPGDGYVQIGLQLGNLTDFKTFDELWNAWCAQVEYLTRYFVELCNFGVDIRIANVSKLIKSCMTEACIERGLQLDEGGAIYNYGCIETGGHGTVGDSLYAIKKLVYDEKRITPHELDAALKANFEGYEEIRLMLRNVPKYGNGHEEADAMAARVLEHFWSEIAKYTTRRGQAFTGACSLLEGGIEMGADVGALPDGRFAGEPLGNSVGPRTGSDTNGVTNMLISVSRMPLHLGMGGSGCNVLFPRELLQTPESRTKAAGLIKTFMMMGGQLAQITTASLEDMKDAQVHPEEHGNLIVRVGGFSKKFVDCERETQDEVIKRYGE